MFNINDKDSAGYQLLENFILDFDLIYSTINSYTEVELAYAVRGLEYENFDIKNLGNVIKSEIQKDIIDCLLQAEFADYEDWEEFESEYGNEIIEYAESAELLIPYDGYYVINTNIESNVEYIIGDNDSIENYKLQPIDYLELVNTLNRKFPIKFLY